MHAMGGFHVDISFVFRIFTRVRGSTSGRHKEDFDFEVDSYMF